MLYVIWQPPCLISTMFSLLTLPTLQQHIDLLNKNHSSQSTQLFFLFSLSKVTQFLASFFPQHTHISLPSFTPQAPLALLTQRRQLWPLSPCTGTSTLHKSHRKCLRYTKNTGNFFLLSQHTRNIGLSHIVHLLGSIASTQALSIIFYRKSSLLALHNNALTYNFFHLALWKLYYLPPHYSYEFLGFVPLLPPNRCSHYVLHS